MSASSAPDLAPAAEGAPAPGGRALSGNGGARLLVVDDDTTTRRALAMRLQAHGFRILTAASGEEALAVIAGQPVDLMLLDMRMPGLSGLDVLQLVRREFSTVQLPVIMVTVSEQRADVVHALQAGASDYIVKPGDMPVMIARIQTQLSLKQAMDSLQSAQQDLEDRVARRTEELLNANARLEQEMEARHGSERALRASEKRYRSLYDDNPSMFFTLDAEGTVISVNRFGAHHLGYTRSDLLGRAAVTLYHEEDREALAEHLHGLMSGPHRLHRWEIRKRHRDGNAFWARETARRVEDSQGRGSILLVCEDISETQHLWERLSYQESHDALTGLLNRLNFEGRLGALLREAKTEHSEHALCYLDLDQFKVINDTCGHAAGDELLRQIARLLEGASGKFGTLARLGGDEFALLMEYCTMDQARALVQRIRESIHDYPFAWGESIYRLSASIGLVGITAASGDAAAVLGMADAACFAAKDAGRNRLHVYHERDESSLRHHGEMHWVAKINQALAHDRFELHVQRICPVQRRDTSQEHLEVLLRMRDPEGKLVSPGTFLPACERYNLAVKIDRWVLTRTLRWLGEHPEALSRMEFCAINLSGRSLGDESFVEFLVQALEASGIPAAKLCFELTETAAIANLSQARQLLSALSARGCRFALDDFGSGLSSFGYLKNLPVHYLKIDGSFVKDLIYNPIDYAMVKSINDIGHVMGKRTIAEFVEDGATLRALESLGVDYVQGYWLGRPEPIDEWFARAVRPDGES